MDNFFSLKRPPRGKKISKRYLRAESKDHLKKFIQLFLESLDRNAIELSRVSAFTSKILNEMEIEGICYLKRMPNGRIYLFKKLLCCCTVKKWKECPKFHCPIWPCNEDLECPHKHQEILPLNVDVEITFSNSKQKKRWEQTTKKVSSNLVFLISIF